MHAAITWESCAFIYVCVFVPMYACTYLSVHAWGYTRDNKRRYRMFIHVCMHVCIYGPTYVRDSSRSEILTFTHVWYVCLYANMYACRYMCTCKYVGSHTYSIHTKTRVRKPGGLEVEWEGKDMWYYTHTHTHIHMHVLQKKGWRGSESKALRARCLHTKRWYVDLCHWSLCMCATQRAPVKAKHPELRAWMQRIGM